MSERTIQSTAVPSDQVAVEPTEREPVVWPANQEPVTTESAAKVLRLFAGIFRATVTVPNAPKHLQPDLAKIAPQLEAVADFIVRGASTGADQSAGEAEATATNEGERWSALRKRLVADLPYCNAQGHYPTYSAKLDAWASYIAQLETRAALREPASSPAGEPVAWMVEARDRSLGDVPFIGVNRSTAEGMARERGVRVVPLYRMEDRT